MTDLAPATVSPTILPPVTELPPAWRSTSCKFSSSPLKGRMIKKAQQQHHKASFGSECHASGSVS